MIRRVLIVAVAALLLTGCGVPVDDAPRRAAGRPGPFNSTASGGADSNAGRANESLCFVREDRLGTVVRRVDYLPDVDTHLRHLLAGPGNTERDAGFISALTGTASVAGARLSGGVAEVEVGGAGDETGRSDQILAFGQIVCTLTSRADVHGVTFRRDGQPLDVPRADGSLSRLPLTAIDYAPLIGRR
ncbi:GerMN domain-containing protein [Micromonospora sp. NPDC093277]|uniref:GerMN domain-containing protein n=1 Tax=Micromonospora sp. NPDC093277 TaxID=3364291 RepID=UPI0037FFD1C9